MATCITCNKEAEILTGPVLLGLTWCQLYGKGAIFMHLFTLTFDERKSIPMRLPLNNWKHWAKIKKFPFHLPALLLRLGQGQGQHCWDLLGPLGLFRPIFAFKSLFNINKLRIFFWIFYWLRPINILHLLLHGQKLISHFHQISKVEFVYSSNIVKSKNIQFLDISTDSFTTWRGRKPNSIQNTMTELWKRWPSK